MDKPASSLDFSIISSINNIPKDDWDRLFPKDLIESWGYQKTLEEAGLREFTIRYLLAKREGALVAIIPFFLMDFSFDTLVKGRLRQSVLAMQKRFKRFLKMKLIFLGSPTSEEFSFGASDKEDLSALLDGSIKKIAEFAREEKAAGFLFNNISQNDARLTPYLKKRGFIEMETLPTTSIEIKASTVEDYIQNLSKNCRKDLKRKLRRSSEFANLTTELREDIGPIGERIYELYLNNFKGADVRFETLTREFFENICANMPGVAKYFVTYEGGKIVAFNLCLAKGNVCIDKFVGFDDEVARKYHLYFTTFYHNIDWCIKNGYRFYVTGTTDYYPKLRLGARLVPLYIYAKSSNPLLHSLMRSLAGFIAPKKMDSFTQGTQD